MKAYIEEKEKELYEEIKLQRIIMRKNPIYTEPINELINDLYKQLNQYQGIKKYCDGTENVFLEDCEKMFGWYSLNFIQDYLSLFEKQVELERAIRKLDKKYGIITPKDFLSLLSSKILVFQIKNKLSSIFDQWKQEINDSSIYMEAYLFLKKKKLLKKIKDCSCEKKFKTYEKEMGLWKSKLIKQKI